MNTPTPACRPAASSPCSAGAAGRHLGLFMRPPSLPASTSSQLQLLDPATQRLHVVTVCFDIPIHSAAWTRFSRPRTAFLFLGCNAATPSSGPVVGPRRCSRRAVWRPTSTTCRPVLARSPSSLSPTG